MANEQRERLGQNHKSKYVPDEILDVLTVTMDMDGRLKVLAEYFSKELIFNTEDEQTEYATYHNICDSLLEWFEWLTTEYFTAKTDEDVDEFKRLLSVYENDIIILEEYVEFLSNDF